MMSPETLSTLPDGQRELYESNPLWSKLLYGLGTIGSLIASIGLVMRKSWSIPLFLMALVAIIIQMFYGWFVTNSIEVLGTTAGLTFPIIIILIAIFLWYYAKKAQTNGWLN